MKDANALKISCTILFTSLVLSCSQVSYSAQTVYVIDTTRSMTTILPALKTALVKHLESKKGDFSIITFRDRPYNKQKCKIDYIYNWRLKFSDNNAETTSNLEDIFTSINTEQCGSGEPSESVYDSLYRAIYDSTWTREQKHQIVLITDSLPHTVNTNKNPRNISASQLLSEFFSKRIYLKIAIISEGSTSSFEWYNKNFSQNKYVEVYAVKSNYTNPIVTYTNISDILRKLD